MQITRQTEYAIRTLVELARAPEGQLVSARTISENQGVPEGFLLKTIQLLAKSGLVVTQRGTMGGVRLARPADKITIADIVAVVEGPLALNVCLSPGYICEKSNTCNIRKILVRAQQALVAELSKETLADISKGGEVV